MQMYCTLLRQRQFGCFHADGSQSMQKLLSTAQGGAVRVRNGALQEARNGKLSTGK